MGRSKASRCVLFPGQRPRPAGQVPATAAQREVLWGALAVPLPSLNLIKNRFFLWFSSSEKPRITDSGVLHRVIFWSLQKGGMAHLWIKSQKLQGELGKNRKIFPLSLRPLLFSTQISSFLSENKRLVPSSSSKANYISPS